MLTSLRRFAQAACPGPWRCPGCPGPWRFAQAACPGPWRFAQAACPGPWRCRLTCPGAVCFNVLCATTASSRHRIACTAAAAPCHCTPLGAHRCRQPSSPLLPRACMDAPRARRKCVPAASRLCKLAHLAGASYLYWGRPAHQPLGYSGDHQTGEPATHRSAQRPGWRLTPACKFGLGIILQ